RSKRDWSSDVCSSDLVRVDTDRTTDLDTTLELLDSASEDRYSVAWVDLLHRGRAVVTRGEHARVRDLPVARRRDPFRGASPGTKIGRASCREGGWSGV